MRLYYTKFFYKTDGLHSKMQTVFKLSCDVPYFTADRNTFTDFWRERYR
jgi:hypothetical protein